jgi:hypothetical protein
VQTFVDRNETIKDKDLKELFRFSAVSSDNFCNNDTLALYHDEDLIQLYEQPKVNATIELVTTTDDENYTF